MKNNSNSDSQLGDFTVDLASKASELATETRKFLHKYYQSNEWIQQFDKHWAESNLPLQAIACAIALIVSLVLGWTLYDGILTDQFFTTEEHAPWYAIAGLSGFISSFSLLTGVLAAKAFSRKYREWLQKQEVQTGTLSEISAHRMQQEQSWDHTRFAGMLLFTLSVILLIVYQRFVWFTVEQGQSDLIDFLLLALPIIAFVFEVICSEGAILFLRRYLLLQSRNRDFEKFVGLRAALANLDKQVVMQWKKLVQSEATPVRLADVRCALFRATFRPTDSEHYADEITPDELSAFLEIQLPPER